MLFISFFRWWYSDGWKQRAQLMNMKLDGVIDFFSIDLLAKTLFQPFRQDSVGNIDGPLDAKLKAVLDNLISRILGAIIRLFILVTGLVAIAGYSILMVVTLLLWVIAPAFPVVGVMMAALGVTF